MEQQPSVKKLNIPVFIKKPYAYPKVTVVPLTTEERVSECFLRPFQEACKKLGTKG